MHQYLLINQVRPKIEKKYEVQSCVKYLKILISCLEAFYSKAKDIPIQTSLNGQALTLIGYQSLIALL